MAIKNIFKKEKKASKAKPTGEKRKAASKATKKEEVQKSVSSKAEKNIQRYILKKPWISEKATVLQEARTYVFHVHENANKSQVGKEVETRYGVAPKSVRILNRRGKEKRFGRSFGRRTGYKKAMVTLKKGDVIDIA